MLVAQTIKVRKEEAKQSVFAECLPGKPKRIKPTINRQMLPTRPRQEVFSRLSKEVSDDWRARVIHVVPNPLSMSGRASSFHEGWQRGSSLGF